MSTFLYFFFFFFNDTATTEIYTLSLHDALPICPTSPSARRVPSRARRSAVARRRDRRSPSGTACRRRCAGGSPSDRKSTRLNSSHDQISYAVFCLKKKKN